MCLKISGKNGVNLVGKKEHYKAEIIGWNIITNKISLLETQLLSNYIDVTDSLHHTRDFKPFRSCLCCLWIDLYVLCHLEIDKEVITHGFMAHSRVFRGILSDFKLLNFCAPCGSCFYKIYYWFFCFATESCISTKERVQFAYFFLLYRYVDPHWSYADSDPLNLVNADPDPGQLNLNLKD